MAVPADYALVAQQLYVAYFGRPADYFGLENMTNALAATGLKADINSIAGAYASNASVKAMFDNFGSSAESNSLYNGSDAAFISAIYNNVLNRFPDISGLSFWVNALGSGAMNRTSAAAQILAATVKPDANPADMSTVSAKVAMATMFTASVDTPAKVISYTGNIAAALARSLLSTVTSTTDPAAFKLQIDMFLDPPFIPYHPTQYVNLTTATDVLVGGAGNDLFFATLPLKGAAIDAGATLTTGDRIDGAAGYDTLSLVISGTASAMQVVTPVLKNLEKMLVSNLATGTPEHAVSVVVDLSQADAALAHIGTSASSAAATGMGTTFQNVATLLAVEQAGAGNLEVVFNSSVVAGATDSLALTLYDVGSAATAAVFKTSGVETLNIASNGSNYVVVDDANLKTVTISAAGAISLSFEHAGAAGTAPLSINASAATGAVKLSAGAGDQNIVTGTGNDIISGGAGADTINVGTGSDTLAIAAGTTGGGGDSGTFTLAAGAIVTTGFDVVTGMGAGDRIQLSPTAYTGNAGAAAGLIANGTAATSFNGLVLLDNGIEIVRGTYAAGSFTASASGADSMLIYDAAANLGYTAYEAIVLIGYVAGTLTGIGANQGVIVLA